MPDLAQRIARSIRERRQKAGLSQLDLAELAGLSLNHVGLVERGQRSPSVRALERVARALGADAAELLSRGGGT